MPCLPKILIVDEHAVRSVGLKLHDVVLLNARVEMWVCHALMTTTNKCDFHSHFLVIKNEVGVEEKGVSVGTPVLIRSQKDAVSFRMNELKKRIVLSRRARPQNLLRQNNVLRA